MCPLQYLGHTYIKNELLYLWNSTDLFNFIWQLGHPCMWPWSWSWGGSDQGELVFVDEKTLPPSWIWGVRKRGIRWLLGFQSREPRAPFTEMEMAGVVVCVCVWWGPVLFKGIANRKWRHGSLILSELNVIAISSPFHPHPCPHPFQPSLFLLSI